MLYWLLSLLLWPLLAAQRKKKLLLKLQLLKKPLLLKLQLKKLLLLKLLQLKKPLQKLLLRKKLQLLNNSRGNCLENERGCIAPPFLLL